MVTLFTNPFFWKMYEMNYIFLSNSHVPYDLCCPGWSNPEYGSTTIRNTGLRCLRVTRGRRGILAKGTQRTCCVTLMAHPIGHHRQRVAQDKRVHDKCMAWNDIWPRRFHKRGLYKINSNQSQALKSTITFFSIFMLYIYVFCLHIAVTED